MKYHLFFLLFPVFSGLFAQSTESEPEGKLDSLLQQYINVHQIVVTPQELPGTYRRTDGYFSESVKIKEDRTFEIRSRGCFGPAFTERGKWEIKGMVIILFGKGGEEIKVRAIKIDENFALMFPSSVRTWKALAVDSYKLKDMEMFEGVIAGRDELINAELYKKYPPLNNRK